MNRNNQRAGASAHHPRIPSRRALIMGEMLEIKRWLQERFDVTGDAFAVTQHPPHQGSMVLRHGPFVITIEIMEE